MENSGADANDEFARWLAETAKADPVAPGSPAPTAPPAPRGTPESFGADELASPPTRPYEAPNAGPQFARSSFQPAVDPSAPRAPQAPAPADPQPPAQSFAAPRDAYPPAPTAQQPAPPLPPTPAAPPPPAAPTPPAAPPPSVAPPPAAPPPSAAPPPAPPPPAFFPPPVPPPASAPPSAPAPPAGWDPPTVQPPPSAAVPPVLPPLVPDAGATPSSPVGEQTPADPFGSLFTELDSAARLAEAPPPDVTPRAEPDPPPLVAPDTDPSDALSGGDALSSLFGGLDAVTGETVQAPTDPFASNPVTPPAPTYAPEQPFASEPQLAPSPPAPPADPAPAPELPDPVRFDAGSGSRPTIGSPPPASDDPLAGTQFFGGGTGDYEEPPDLDRTTVGEKVAFALAFVVPPVGLIASIVAAAQSARRRGWVHGFVRVSLVVAIVTTIAAGIAGAYGYRVLEDERNHASIKAASAQFCATVGEQPDMITPPTFGFPAPGASIPDTLALIQTYIDRWDALATVSPSGIRPDVTRMADAARDIQATIESTRLVNNEQNIANMTSVAQSTGIPAWSTEYCD